MWRKLVKFFLWVIGSFIGIVLILALVLYLMRDKIKAYAVEYINSYLKSELHVKDIDVTFISTFPKATVCLKNPYILDPDSISAKRDTLFSASNVYFEFDIWDIFYGKYDIESIRGENVYTRLYVNNQGKENYDIVKPAEERTKEPEEFQLNLKSITADKLRFVYRNDFLSQEYSVIGYNPAVSGLFKGEKINFTYTSKLLINRIRKEKISLLQNQQGKLSFKVEVNNQKNEITFTKGDVTLGKMQLALTGTIKNPADATDVDLLITGKKVPIVSLLSLLPERIRKKSEQYDSRGLVDARVTAKGAAGKRTSPFIVAEFSIDDGSVTEKQSGISLHNIDLAGNYTNRNADGKDEIYLKKFDARMKDGTFSMKYRMKDFTTPHIDATLESDLKLETLHKFISPAYITNMNGALKTSWAFSCTITNPDDITTRTVEIHKANGTLNFTDAEVKLKDMYQTFSSLNGTFTINKTDALIEDFSGKAGSSDFHLNGAIQNLTTYILTGSSTLNMVGSIQSENTDLNDLIPQEEKSEKTAKAGKEHSYEFHFPTLFNLNVDVDIAHLKWNKFRATNLSGNVLMLHDRLDVRHITATAGGGDCSGNITMADIGNNRFKITSASTYTNVNINEAMALFNEFGQEMITSQNLKGKMTAQMEMAAEMDRNLTIDTKTLLASVHLKVKGGELNNMTSLKNISTYMRKDPKARLILKKHAAGFEKRLEHIQFSDMENDIEIRNRTVYIPRMTINSTALDINVSGTHDFDNKVDYRFGFRFRDVKEHVTENEFGIIKDDGTGVHVFLRMFGDVNNPSYELDKEQMKEEFKAKNEEEKKTVKTLLKNEFGMFKKDSTLSTQPEKKDDVEFLLDWNEGDKPTNETGTTEQKKEKGRLKLNRLKKKLGIQEKNSEIEVELEETP